MNKNLSGKIVAVILAVLTVLSCMSALAYAEEVAYKMTIEKNDEEKSISVKKEGDYMYDISPAADRKITEDENDSSTKYVYYYGLKPGTTYTITASTYEKDDKGENKKDEFGEFIKQVVNKQEITIKDVQTAPTAIDVKVTATTATIVAPSKDSEYSKDNKTWQASNEFTKLAPDTSYMFYARYKATESKLASDSVSCQVRTLKASENKTAAAPVAETVTKTSITLKKVDGVEYSIDDGEHWQDSNEFSNLTEDKEYTFVQRVKVDESVQEVNPKSSPAKIKTNTGDVYSAKVSDSVITVEDGTKYANKAFKVTATSVSRPEGETNQWGDTRLVPAQVKDGGDMTYDQQSKAYVGTYSAPAKGTYSVYVIYKVEEYRGANNWVAIGTETGSVNNISVGAEYDEATANRVKFLNIFTNTLPNLATKALNYMVKLFNVGYGIVSKFLANANV